MKKPKVGDIIQIQTSKGLAYAQYTYKHKTLGALLRILPGLYKEQPKDFSELVRQRERFWIFFPLSAAVNRDIVSIVANQPVPDFAQKFPTFRTGVIDPATRKVALWWLWDGEREWQVGELTPEQRKLSIRGIWNDTLLIERIESGWSPENDPT